MSSDQTRERPSFIKHWKEVQQPDDSCYPNSDELLAIGSPLGKAAGLLRVGVHHEVLPPGRRSSRPHAESTEEEAVYVLEGHPGVWIDGVLHPLSPGDFVGFPSGTGIAHTFLNNSDKEVRLLVIGEATKSDNQIHTPKNPEDAVRLGPRHWKDVPKRTLGDHDGLPDALRDS